MMDELMPCPFCSKFSLETKSRKTIADTEYKILKCNKCRHQVARCQR